MDSERKRERAAEAAVGTDEALFVAEYTCLNAATAELLSASVCLSVHLSLCLSLPLPSTTRSLRLPGQPLALSHRLNHLLQCFQFLSATPQCRRPLSKPSLVITEFEQASRTQ